MKANASLSLLSKFFYLSFGMIPRPNKRVTGINSRIPGTNKHTVMLDYDEIEQWVLEDELRALQEDFQLGDFHLLRGSESSFNPVCLDEVPLFELRQIQLRSSCDLAYMTAPRYDTHRGCVTRITMKGNRPVQQYAKSLLHKTQRKQHLGSAKVLESVFGVPLELLQNSDGNERVMIEKYLTGRRT